MTVGAWLSERTPAPPPRLSARIVESLGDATNAPRERAGDVCIDAAECLLRELLARPTAGRESALDLLTVDALVTYAFEAGGDAPGDLARRAAGAARRLAAAAG